MPAATGRGLVICTGEGAVSAPDTHRAPLSPPGQRHDICAFAAAASMLGAPLDAALSYPTPSLRAATLPPAGPGAASTRRRSNAHGARAPPSVHLNV
jgi:hypothetical protein